MPALPYMLWEERELFSQMEGENPIDGEAVKKLVVGEACRRRNLSVYFGGEELRCRSGVDVLCDICGGCAGVKQGRNREFGTVEMPANVQSRLQSPSTLQTTDSKLNCCRSS